MKHMLILLACSLLTTQGCGRSDSPAATRPTAAPPAPAMAGAAPAVPAGAGYFLSATGSDDNAGTSRKAPWLTPNHPLHCGDTITALPSTAYRAANFASGKWGTVACVTGDNVATLQCAVFDACRITAGTNEYGVYVDKSYWAVMGFEATTAREGLNCFAAGPNVIAPVNIDHVLFANDIANGCGGGGFGSFNVESDGIDYVAFVGDIAYNSAQGRLHCTSGFSIYQPVMSDHAEGTHLYIAGDFAWANLNPAICDGTPPMGGDGAILDTLDGSQGLFPSTYLGQAVVENNIFVGNGGRGIEVQNNSMGPRHAVIVRRSNTIWGNSTDPHQTTKLCSEFSINTGLNIRDTKNIVQTTAAKACGGNALYASFVYQGDASDTSEENWFSAEAGAYAASSSFDAADYKLASSNRLNVLPQFAAPSIPPPPACRTFESVPACMASMIDHFRPLAKEAASLGYQTPSSAPIYDPLYPHWLCALKMPAGLVTPGCLTN